MGCVSWIAAIGFILGSLMFIGSAPHLILALPAIMVVPWLVRSAAEKSGIKSGFGVGLLTLVAFGATAYFVFNLLADWSSRPMAPGDHAVGLVLIVAWAYFALSCIGGFLAVTDG